MIPIPFSSALGPNAGVAADGVIYGVLPQVPPASALSEAHLAPLTSVYRGNADATGNIMWENVTVAASNDVIGDVSLFDATNPSADRLCVELSAGDEVSGISLLISTAASLAGAPVATVRYRTAAGWATATGIVTPTLTSVGLKTIQFATIKYTDITPTDNLVDPFNAAQQRCLYLYFTGITGVTTVPLFTRVWKKIAHASPHKATNYTAPVVQGANPDFSALQNAILPTADDITVMGFDAPIVRLRPTIYRPTAAGLGAREWVYSKADGTWAILPAANINDPSQLFGAPLGTVNTPSTNLVSTYTGGTWGSAGGYSNESLPASVNGYLEFEVSSTPTVPGFIGLNADPAANNHYTGIDFAIHVGNGNTANATLWTSGTMQAAAGTRAIVAGDKFRLERANGNTFSVYHNNQLWYTFTATLADEIFVDVSLLNLTHIDNVILVNTTNATPVAIDLTWTGLTLMTATAGTGAMRVPTTHQININPPADWGKISMTDTADVAHNRYWIGWRYTADTPAPVLPVNFTVRGQPVKGDGVVGIPATENATYTTLTVACRETPPNSEVLLMVNGSTGEIGSVTVPANSPITTATVSLPVAKGDQLLLVHVLGSDNSLSDGVILAS